jgi:hypothetical protein
MIYDNQGIFSTYLCCSLVHSLIYLVKFFWIAIVGDITPSDGIPKAEKSRREQEALDHMCKLLGGGSRGTLFSNSVCVCVCTCTCVVVKWLGNEFVIPQPESDYFLTNFDFIFQNCSPGNK